MTPWGAEHMVLLGMALLQEPRIGSGCRDVRNSLLSRAEHAHVMNEIVHIGEHRHLLVMMLLHLLGLSGKATPHFQAQVCNLGSNMRECRINQLRCWEVSWVSNRVELIFHATLERLKVGGLKDGMGTKKDVFAPLKDENSGVLEHSVSHVIHHREKAIC